MRILGVLDLMHGVVVRGVGGRREQYRPLVSRLCATADPVPVALALQQSLGLTDFYLADLDAIAGAEPAWQVYDALRALGVRLWIDAGVRTLEDGRKLAGHGTVVAGLETVTSLEVVSELAEELGNRLVFSLDLRGGTPLAWGTDSAGIAAAVIARGVRRLLVLDLARVGTGDGTGTEALCAALAARHPAVELIAGGGIRGRADLERLRDCGVSAVLIASALHDGRLTRTDLALG